MKIDYRGIGRFFKRNGHIIAAIGATFGVGITTFEAVKAGARIKAKFDISKPETFKEKAKIAAPELVTTAVAAGGTVAAIAVGAVGAEACIGALAAGMSTTMNKLRDYQTAVAQIDPKVADQANKVVAQATISEIGVHPVPSEEEVLYYDSLTETEFTGEPGLALRAANRLRARLTTMGYITLTDYMDALGIPRNKKMYGAEQFMAWDQFSFCRKGHYPTMEIADLMASDGLEIFEELVIDDNGTLERHYLWPSHDPDVNLLDKNYTKIVSPS